VYHATKEGGAFRVESLFVFANQGRSEPHHHDITTTLPIISAVSVPQFDVVPVEEADAPEKVKHESNNPVTVVTFAEPTVLPGVDDGANLDLDRCRCKHTKTNMVSSSLHDRTVQYHYLSLFLVCVTNGAPANTIAVTDH
jgi:hypothetical protein